MTYFVGFQDNVIIGIQKDGTPPFIFHSGKRINEKVLEQLENDLITHGIERIFRLLNEVSLPLITQNIPKNDPSSTFNETILCWNPNLLLTLDKSTIRIESTRDNAFPASEFWDMVPTILEEKKRDLKEFISGDDEMQALLSNYLGFYGYISYEANLHLESKQRSADSEIIPTSILTFPSNYLIERENDFLYIELKGLFTGSPGPIDAKSVSRTEDISSNVDFETYIEKINSIKKHIFAGDIYQANFTQRFAISTDKITQNSREIYIDLIRKNHVRHSAYLEYIDMNIISISPELFLSVKNGKILTKPIKGTRPRGTNPKHDQELVNELISSEKDQAELAMIVDLLRNDLGKSCKPGTVKVEKHAAIESFSNVHHLVSSITAEIDPNPKDSWRLFLRAFPGGSITGCPKIRAMEIIEELETIPRGVYTGSIGYLALNGNMQFNIAIRTITMTQDEIVFNAGGGIVADSDPIDEYVESLHKATHLASYFNQTFTGNIAWLDGKYIFKEEIDKLNIRDISHGFFETILINNSKVQHLPRHWKRLKRGIEYYGIDPILPSEEDINTLIKINLGKDARLKLSVIMKGDKVYSLLELRPYQISREPIQLMIREKIFNYPQIIHKGIKPLDYANYKESTLTAQQNGQWDSILLDNELHMLETGRANLYFYIDKWYTPSNHCVHGVVRESLLSKKLVFERLINFDELSKVKAIAVSSALIGILPVTKISNDNNDVIWMKSDDEVNAYLENLIH